jgi:hypothetical protein
VTVSELRESLRNPGPLMGPIPMWFWNGSLDHDMLIGQIDRMLKQGIRAYFIHPMPQEFRTDDFVHGLDAEYLGDEYMAAVAAVVSASEERGMKVWLYDEGGWPSGPNCGKLLAERPDLCGKIARYNEEGNVEILDRGYPVDLLNRETTDTFIQQVHEQYAKAVGDHFGKTIVGFFTDEPRFAGRVGGAEIPWSPGLPEAFKERKGYDISLGLAILFGLKAARSLDESKRAQVIFDFYDVVTQVWRDNWWAVLQTWCNDHDLLLTGHLAGDDAIASHLTNGADFFRAMECVDWPGIDVIQHQIHPDTDNQNPNDFPKYASSAAHVTSRNRTLSESFAVYGWDLSFDEMRWITNFQYVRGVNAISPMAFYSDVRGARKIGTMSDQFGANPLFSSYGSYAEYVSRLSTVMTLGDPVVEVALYYPMRSLWFQTDTRIDTSLQHAGRGLLERQIDYDYVGDDALAGAELADDGALCVGHGKYRAILIPTISTVPIETMRMIRDFAAKGGILVLLGEKPHLTCRAGDTQELMDILVEIESHAIVVTNAGDQDVAFGTLAGTVRLGVANPDIRVCRRSADGVEVFLLTNESTVEAHALRVKLPVDGTPYIYDPERDSVVPADVTGGTVRVSLEPSSARVIIVGDDEIDADTQTPGDKPSKTIQVEGPWKVDQTKTWTYQDGEFVVQAGGGLDKVAAESDDALMAWASMDSAPVEEVSAETVELLHWDELFGAVACGEAVYTTELSLDSSAQHIELDLGVVGVTATVTLNDVNLGSRVWPPYAFDITEAVQEGTNALTIQVRSTLHRLASSDAVIADLKERGWFNTYAQHVEKHGGEAKPAGLIGPVTIQMWD